MELDGLFSPGYETGDGDRLDLLVRQFSRREHDRPALVHRDSTLTDRVSLHWYGCKARCVTASRRHVAGHSFRDVGPAAEGGNPPTDIGGVARHPPVRATGGATGAVAFARLLRERWPTFLFSNSDKLWINIPSNRTGRRSATGGERANTARRDRVDGTRNRLEIPARVPYPHRESVSRARSGTKPRLVDANRPRADAPDGVARQNADLDRDPGVFSAVGPIP